MEYYHSNVCIGGPLDGKRYLHDGPYFRAAVSQKLELAIVPDDPDAPSMSIEFVTYNRTAFHASQEKTITFWLADTEDNFRALVRLLNRYQSRAQFIERAKGLLYNVNSLFFQGTVVGKDTAHYANDLFVFLTNLIEHLEATETKE